MSDPIDSFADSTSAGMDVGTAFVGDPIPRQSTLRWPLMLPRLNSEHGGRIEAPARFFSELGNLHDAKIRLIEWDPVRREVALVLEDLYSNFVGLPEYTGLQPARLILNGISRFEIDATSDRFPMRVVDFEIEEVGSDSKTRVLVKMGPSGFIRVTCDSIAGHPT